MSDYIERVIKECEEKNPGEMEFHQTVEEVLRSLEPVIERHPEYEKATGVLLYPGDQISQAGKGKHGLPYLAGFGR